MRGSYLHLIIIPVFDLDMKMNATNVAQRKNFRRKSSFVDKRMNKKIRFGELSTEKIPEIVDSAVAGTT